VAVGSARYTVTSTAQVVGAGASGSGQGPSASAYMSNSGAIVYLGGAGVTTGNGVALADGASLTLWLFPGDRLYAVCATTSTLSVLQT
jgi:hypothetical protein